jgi:hypothetical protein
MPGETGSDVMDVLEHIQQQLTYLEKKMDMLLGRVERERPFDNSRQAPRPFRKPYDKPSQRFDRPPRRDRNDSEDRERGYSRDRESSRDNYFDRRKAGKKPGGKPRPGGAGKKPFYSRYSD